MSDFEYRAVPAPRKSKPVKGVKGKPERFAKTISDVINDMSAIGWEYLRADTMPCEEHGILKGKYVENYALLLFRRKRVPVKEIIKAEPPVQAPAPKNPAESPTENSDDA